MRIGVISDTHGLLPSQAMETLQGAEQIIHAGDVGRQEIISRLETIAPVKAVTGNIDWGGPLDLVYPKILSFTVGGCRIFVKHVGDKPVRWSQHLPQPRPDVAICGHSHIALQEMYEDVLYLNPGSAGQARFGRGLSLAILTIEAGQARAELVSLSK
jgi:putative phosphoesterase